MISSSNFPSTARATFDRVEGLDVPPMLLEGILEALSMRACRNWANSKHMCHVALQERLGGADLLVDKLCMLLKGANPEPGPKTSN